MHKIYYGQGYILINYNIFIILTSNTGGNINDIGLN